ncbi:MAG TPA: mannosyltransferase family protein [Chthoniobacterales bacterium]
MRQVFRFLGWWLLLVNLFALVVVNRLDLMPDKAFPWINPWETQQLHSWNPISLHARWDSIWLLELAKHGYHWEGGTRLTNLNFPPLYPFLMRIVAPLTAGNYILAGWIVSVLCLAGALAVFYRLVQEFHPEIDPQQPIFYLLIFPASFALNAVYAESLFLLLSLLTIYFALKGRFVVSGIFGGLAALTRINGILLFVPAAWEYFRRHGRAGLTRRSVAGLFLIPLGTFLFFLHHYFFSGNFFLYMKIQSRFGRQLFRITPEHFVVFSHPAVANLLTDVTVLVFLVGVTWLIFKRGWTSYGLYLVASLFLIVATGTLVGIARYSLVLFPIFIALASIKSHQFERAYTLGSVLLMGLSITLFVNWYWGM